MSVIHNLTNAAVITLFMLEHDAVITQHETIFNVALHNHLVWVLWVVVFFNLLTFGFLGHLIIFHMYIQKEGISTYEHIKRKENRKKASKIVVRVTRDEEGNIVKEQPSETKRDLNSIEKQKSTDIDNSTNKKPNKLKSFLVKLSGLKLSKRNSAQVIQRDNTSPNGQDNTGDSNKGGHGLPTKENIED